MTKKERFAFVLKYFEEHAPNAETELIYDNPYQLLVAVILSAQCTDKRVNMTTPAIFERYPDVYALSKATFDELFPYIRSISYPNNKTKHLIGMAQKVTEEFNGEIPATVQELITLPGVGRKTADHLCSASATQYGGGYPRLQGISPHRPYHQRQNTTANRTAAAAEYSQR